MRIAFHSKKKKKVFSIQQCFRLFIFLVDACFHVTQQRRELCMSCDFFFVLVFAFRGYFEIRD